MYTPYQLYYLGFHNKNYLIRKWIKLKNLFHNQYMGPYIFTHIFCKFKNMIPLKYFLTFLYIAFTLSVNTYNDKQLNIYIAIVKMPYDML